VLDELLELPLPHPATTAPKAMAIKTTAAVSVPRLLEPWCARGLSLSDPMMPSFSA
jgi:hypothetical protein